MNECFQLIQERASIHKDVLQRVRQGDRKALRIVRDRHLEGIRFGMWPLR